MAAESPDAWIPVREHAFVFGDTQTEFSTQMLAPENRHTQR
jgi:hypothetical protein